METAASAPVPDPTGVCRSWGESRSGDDSVRAGVFQHMGVLPDGSGVVVEVTDQLSLYPSPPVPPQGEGIFFVRTDGRGLRRLGPASHFPTQLPPPAPPLSTGPDFSVSPDGRSIVFIDEVPDANGHDTLQVFLLDLRSGRRTQLTHLPPTTPETQPGIRFARFIGAHTVGFHTGSPVFNTPIRSYRVSTDGGGVVEEIPAPTLSPGAQVVSQFGVTRARPQIILVSLPGLVFELFLVDRRNLTQLTNFGRAGTGYDGGFFDRGRVLFTAEANPSGDNPAGICQLFSINELGSDLRQLTHLRSDGRPPFDSCGGYVYPPACRGIDPFSLVPDPVTGTVLFASNCDPVGRNGYGEQLFAIGSDGSGLRQLTSTRGLTTDPDGTVHVEMPRPFAYAVGPP
jgi:hypothetical protein